MGPSPSLLFAFLPSFHVRAGSPDNPYPLIRGGGPDECQKPQPPLLLKKYRNTPPLCTAKCLQFISQCFWCPYALRKGKFCQFSSHLYRSTPPIRIAIRLPFVLQYASHLYRSTVVRILVVVIIGMLVSGGPPPLISGGAVSKATRFQVLFFCPAPLIKAVRVHPLN